MPLKKIIIFLLCAVPFSACVEHSKDALHSTNISVDQSEAREYLNDLSEDYPNDPQVHYQLARVNFSAGDYRQALANVKQAKAIQRDNPEYHYLIGKIYQKLNKPELGVQSLLMAETLGKKNHELYRMVAEAYMQLEQPHKAIEAIGRMTSLNESADAYTLKGEVMLSLKDTAEAIKDFNRATKIDPAAIKPYMALADISIARKNEESAFQYIDKLLYLQPENYDFLIRKAELLQLSGHPDAAKPLFRTVASERKNYMDFYRLANVYYVLRQYDSAQFAAQEAYRRNNKFLNAQLIVARSLDKSRKYPEAIEVYEKLVASDSTFDLAMTELDNLRRKVAYLWRLKQQRQKAKDSANVPAAIEKKEIDD